MTNVIQDQICVKEKTTQTGSGYTNNNNRYK